MIPFTEEVKQTLTRAAEHAIAENKPFPLAVYSGGKTNHTLTEKSQDYGWMIGTISLPNKFLLVYKM